MGEASTVIITLSGEEGHTPFEIVQRNVDEAPMVNPVTPDVANAGVVTIAVPAITDQEPLPVAGAFPANVAVVTLHKV